MSPYLAFFIGLTTAFVIDAVFCIYNKKKGANCGKRSD